MLERLAVPQRSRWAALGAAIAVAALIAAFVYASAGDAPPPRMIRAAAGVAGNLADLDTRSDPDGVVFDIETVRVYDIQLSEEHLQTLNRDPIAEQYVPGAVVVDGVRFDNIGVRYKGYFGVLRACFATGVNTCDKLSYKLKFDHYLPGQRYHGLKRLNFHPMSGDDAQMREILTYWTFRDAGVAAPRAVYAELRLNGEPLGLFTLTEDIDDRFIADRFDDVGLGVLTKEWWPASLDHLPNLVERPRDTIARGPSDLSGLRAFGAALNAAGSPAETFAVLESYMHDLDQLYRYLAADRLTDNWDGIVAWYCTPECRNHNFFLYEHPATDAFTLIPWDTEHSWRGISPIREYYGMPDWDELHRGCETVTVFWNLEGRPPYCDQMLHALAMQGWERYIAASRWLLEEALPEPTLQARVNQLSRLIDPYVRADRNGPGALAWQEAVRDIRWEIGQRYDYIAEKIADWDRDERAPADD